ncbi:hypothetical protein [Hydrogenovibrio marinus]|uniref:Uncharacterized protein n=1 Tax=Hydrogenovibrio marinus TaxID=28885 RepID=A0A066ZWJ4_HYDMR|nr:hypothetical protein [Hydrogenovibrio marinus]KDN94686.1 hypothetical protein EI16_12365 [Hydrogenovibrio marinus]
MTKDPIFEPLREPYLHLLSLMKKDIDDLDVQQTDQLLEEIEEQEQKVLMVYAKLTEGINPGSIKEVKEGRLKYTGKRHDYFARMLGLNN